MSSQIVNINELDLNIINPTDVTAEGIEKGGSKIVVIGKPGTGKSTLISSILYAKRNIIP